MFLHKEGLSFNRNWTGDLSSSPMRSFSVVPDEPRDQLAIELIGGDKQLLMVIDEFLLNGAVKAFTRGRSSWEFWDRYASGFCASVLIPHRCVSQHSI
jgi:hypothetical protein